MSEPLHHFVYGRGTSQALRAEATLDPASARLDERGLPEMLAWVAGFARLVGFVDEHGQPAGDWSSFFAQDESFLLAQVCATTPEGLATRVPADPDAAADGDRDSEAPRADGAPALRRIFAIAQRINEWYEIGGWLRAGSIETHPFAVNLEQVIANDLNRYTQQIEASRSLGPLWRRLADRANVRFASVWARPPTHSVVFDAHDLAPVQSAFERALDNLTALARRYLESSQHESPDHAAHAGLLIAFVKLLGLIQHDQNTFTERHLQHYLRDVLRLAPRASQPDQTLVAFTPVPRAAPVLLEAGRRLAAGVDAAGAPVEFAISGPLVVTQAQIAQLAAVRATHAGDGTASGAASANGGGAPVTSIVAYPVAASADGLGAKLADPARGWPTFGPSRDDAIAAGNEAPDAEVGFAIASTLLLLLGGERTIKLSIELGNSGEGVRLAMAQPQPQPQPPLAPTPGAGAPGSYAQLFELARVYAEALAEDVDTAAGETPPDANDVLTSMLADACTVSLSGKDGWFAPQQARLSVSDDYTLDLVIQLSAAAPAVVANTALAFDKDGPPLPLLRVTMNPQAAVYGFSFLEALRARSMNLEVRVERLQNLALQNNLGPLAVGKPFALFGPVPTLGSAIQIDSPELACKPVSHVSLTIDWLDLPGGFASYYAGYPVEAGGAPLTRASFLVDIAQYDGSGWRPVEGTGGAHAARFALFAPAGRSSAGAQPDAPAASTRFSFDVPGAGIAPLRYAMPQSAAVVPGVQGAVEAGALRVTLAAPSGAFGHGVYSRALAEAVLRNSRAPKRAGPGDLVPIPNAPCVPTASALWLDYTAAGRIDFDALDDDASLRFYTLAPFGYVRAKRGVETRFVPDGVRGALFIGLAGATPGDTLSLLFHLAERDAPQSIDFTGAADAQGDARGSGSALVWHYLDGNVWRAFSQHDILLDSTYGLTCSGILRIALPAGIDARHTLMPAGLLWLAATVADPAGMDFVCDTVGIHPNAVPASRVTSGQTLIANLPPQAITGLVTKLPAIKAVQQPLPAWGGLPAETPAAFATRVAERLRHKARAIQPYDYERLVLGEFAQIAQAKCIGPGNSRGYDGSAPLRAGEVVVVVAARAADGREALVDQNTLRAVLESLRPSVSPFLRSLAVRNPIYERVKVVAAVRLKRATSGAFWLNHLGGELDAFFAPWRTQPEGRLPVGYGAIDCNAVASFIRQRDYVESLEAFHVEVLYNISPSGAGNAWRERWFGADDLVRPATPWSVLVPGAGHVLQQVDGPRADGGDGGAPVPELAPAGIGSVTIGEDFVAGASVASVANGSTAAAEQPAAQTAYYVKFLDNVVRREHRARRDTPPGSRNWVEDTYIAFPDSGQSDAPGGSVPLNGA